MEDIFLGSVLREVSLALFLKSMKILKVVGWFMRYHGLSTCT